MDPGPALFSGHDERFRRSNRFDSVARWAVARKLAGTPHPGGSFIIGSFRVQSVEKISLQTLDDGLLVFGKITPDHRKLEAGKNGRIALTLQQKLEGLLDQLLRRHFSTGEPLIVIVPEGDGVNRRALRPHRDLEGFGILLYNFDLCVVHRILFQPTSRNVKRRPLDREATQGQRYGFAACAYVLISNHVHLPMETEIEYVNSFFFIMRPAFSSA